MKLVQPLAIVAGIALAATATSPAAGIAPGTSIGFDFGPTAPTNNFNNLDGGPLGTSAEVLAGTVIDTNGNIVDNVSLTIGGASFNSFFNSDPSVPITYGVVAPTFYDDSNTTDWYGTFNNPDQPVTITIEGLDDSLTYNLNVFSAMNLTQDIVVDYTVGTSTLTASANHGTGTFSPFVDFTDLTATDGQLIVVMTPGTGSFADLATISALHLTAVDRTPVITSVETGEDGLNTITFSTTSNRPHKIEVSSDLEDWITLSEDEASSEGTITYLDTVSNPFSPKLFYRVSAR